MAGATQPACWRVGSSAQSGHLGTRGVLAGRWEALASRGWATRSFGPRFGVGMGGGGGWGWCWLGNEAAELS